MRRIDVKKLSTEHRLTQKEIADACGVTASFISNCCKGKSFFPEDREEALKQSFPQIDIEQYRVEEDKLSHVNVQGNGNFRSKTLINAQECESTRKAACNRNNAESGEKSTDNDEVRRLQKRESELLKKIEDLTQELNGLKDEKLRILGIAVNKGVPFEDLREFFKV